MVRYKRYKRYGRRRSTNVIKMKFQSFMDISTSDSSMQIITVSAGGEEILKRLAPQFGAYKYYKIGNIAVKLVPASTLPVDPTGLSYTAGEQTVDPRDQLTPGMMRITNGEDVFENISGVSSEVQHAIYNNMLLDPRWFKWMLQSGVKRHATPRYWQIGQLHQDKWPGATVNLPNVGLDGSVVGTVMTEQYNRSSVGTGSVETAGSSPMGFFQVGHRGTLGWLPTDGLSTLYNNSSTKVVSPLLTSPPEVEVMKIILPKAYKTKYYYRMFITETVYFKEPIVNFGIETVIDTVPESFRPIDIFHDVSAPSPSMPYYGRVDTVITDPHTGGNYGDD